MEEEILKKISEQDEKLVAIYKSVERIRKRLLWGTIFTIIIFVLPLLGLAVIIPWFLETLKSTYGGFGL